MTNTRGATGSGTFAPQMRQATEDESIRFPAIFFSVSETFLIFAATTKKVVTKKVVIWKIPLNTEQSWMLITL